jgi:hypothetical protein
MKAAWGASAAFLAFPSKKTAVAYVTVIEYGSDYCGDYIYAALSDGYWGAEGEYVNCWGDCADGERTKWTGEILNLDPFIKITSSLEIQGSTQVPHSYYRTPPPYYGWGEQRSAYRAHDIDVARPAAYSQYINWGAQVGVGHATIDVELPLVHEVLTEPKQVIHLGENLFVAEDESVLYLDDCGTCGESAIITIASYGTVVIVPSGQDVSFDFIGDEGGATVSFLLITIGGFTLDGEFHGVGTSG